LAELFSAWFRRKRDAKVGEATQVWAGEKRIRQGSHGGKLLDGFAMVVQTCSSGSPAITGGSHLIYC